MFARPLIALSSFGILLAACGGTSLEDPGQEQPAEQRSAASLQTAKAGKNCVATIDPTRGDQAAPKSVQPQDVPCFDTFSEAIAFATAGAVKLDPQARPETLSAGDRAALEKASPQDYWKTVAIEFEHGGFYGATLTLRSSVTCYDGYTLDYPIWQYSGWNDVISSAMAFEGCNHALHYEHDPFRPSAVTDCRTGCGWIGEAMNDRTSYLRLSP